MQCGGHSRCTAQQFTDLNCTRSAPSCAAALSRCAQTAISVVSTTGAVLSNLTVGSSNPNSVGDAGAAETVRNGIQAALKQIHGQTTGAARLCVRRGARAQLCQLRLSHFFSNLLLIARCMATVCP